MSDDAALRDLATLCDDAARRHETAPRDRAARTGEARRGTARDAACELTLGSGRSTG
jgi:hypothetical protein